MSERIELGHGHGLTLKRDRPGDAHPWTLRRGSNVVAEFTTTTAQALIAACAAPDASLPPGVRPGYVLDANTDVPEGWEIPDDLFAGQQMRVIPVEVRPVPQPETEPVSVDLKLIGRRLPGGQQVTQFTVRTTTELDQDAAPGGLYVEVFLDDAVWANPARNPDGTVEVLKDTPEGAGS